MQQDLFTERSGAPVEEKVLRVLFVGLNPSRADAVVPDHATTKWCGFVGRWAKASCEPIERSAILSPCGRYRYVLRRSGPGWSWAAVNLFAWRETDSIELRRAAGRGVDIVGPENDGAILGEAAAASRIVVCWGAGASFGPRAPAPMRDRDRHVLDLLRRKGRELWCFGRAAGGCPRHPQMLAYSTPLVPFEVTR